MAAKIVAMAPSIMQLHIFAWNNKLKTYVKDGQPEKALQLFQQMEREGMSFDKFIFIQVVNACVRLQALDDGKHVHEQINQNGC